MPEPTKQKVPSIFDAVNNAITRFDDLADAIANPNPDRPLRNAIGQSGRLYCDAIGSRPGIYLSPVTPGNLTGPILCKPYWDGAGYDAPVSAVPFTGGQCVGLAYSFKITRISATGVDLGDQTITCGAGWYGPIGVFRTATGPSSEIVGITGFNVSGVARSSTIISGAPGAQITPKTFVRCAGGADSCGNPAAILQPGTNPPPIPPPFAVGEEPGTDPDGQPFFYVPPIAAPGGDPIEVPPLEPTGGPPPGPGSPGTPVDTGVGGDAEEEADEGQMLWALKINITTFPPSPSSYADGVYRGVGWIYMGDESGLDHDPAGAMLRDGQLVLAERDYLTRWRVKANQGYDLLVTPYYKSNGE